jgi:hypothetical protein
LLKVALNAIPLPQFQFENTYNMYIITEWACWTFLKNVLRLKLFGNLLCEQEIDYSVTCLNWTFLGPSFLFGIDRCSVYTGWIN